MLRNTRKGFRARLILMILTGVTGFLAVVLLSVNVKRDLNLLNSANSDNVQWTLSQTEVEFLEFKIRLDLAIREDKPDLDELRRKFDIFYSRISTLQQASIYAPVRRLPEFSTNLSAIHTFLNDAVQAIDANDPDLILRLPELSDSAQMIRSSVRGLSNSGLNFFATESDTQRENVSKILIQMAVWVAILLLTLLIFSLYLGYLNRENVRRRRQAIQTSRRMKIVTNTALDAVVVCDQDGRITEFNDAAVQIFGYTAKEAIGSGLGELIAPEQHRPSHNGSMLSILEASDKSMVGKGRVKMDAKRANGDLFPVELAVQSAETDTGEIFIAFLRDISHRVLAEKELVAARDRALAGEKTKTDFLATMSHEIRTPLNGLLGNLALLQDTGLDEQQGRYVKNMDTSGRLLKGHISDVLDITKYDAGKLKLRPVAMNLNTLMQDIVDSLSGAASAQETSLNWQWDGPETEWIQADEERIQHVLMNVIGNAVKFTRKGEVSVRIKAIESRNSAPELEFSVKDSGIGIGEHLKDQIFDDFMTGDASYDRDAEGTGLGLGIARRFVTAMNGHIGVESVEGVGSTFTIRLPIKPIKAPKEQVGVAAKPSEVQGCQILLVEDNEINRLVAREMLAKQGHSITEAHNGQVAVELAQDQQFDLIFMDISMPVMDGRTATRAIRTSNGRSARSPIIALTANAVAEEQAAFLSDGMNSVLTKPLSREALTDVIGKFVLPETDS